MLEGTEGRSGPPKKSVGMSREQLKGHQFLIEACLAWGVELSERQKRIRAYSMTAPACHHLGHRSKTVKGGD